MSPTPPSPGAAGALHVRRFRRPRRSAGPCRAEHGARQARPVGSPPCRIAMAPTSWPRGGTPAHPVWPRWSARPTSSSSAPPADGAGRSSAGRRRPSDGRSCSRTGTAAVGCSPPNRRRSCSRDAPVTLTRPRGAAPPAERPGPHGLRLDRRTTQRGEGRAGLADLGRGHPRRRAGGEGLGRGPARARDRGRADGRDRRPRRRSSRRSSPARSAGSWCWWTTWSPGPRSPGSAPR